MILYLWGQEFPLTWRKKFVFWDSKEQREEDWVGTIRRDVSSPWRNLLQISVKDKMDLPVGFGNSFPIQAEVRWDQPGVGSLTLRFPLLVLNLILLILKSGLIFVLPVLYTWNSSLYIPIYMTPLKFKVLQIKSISTVSWFLVLHVRNFKVITKRRLKNWKSTTFQIHQRTEVTGPTTTLKTEDMTG